MTRGRNRNHERQQAQRVLERRTETRFGTLTSFDPDTMTAKVRIEPEGIETGWLELPTLLAGGGWGITYGPTQGMQVKLDFEGGDIDCAAISHFVFSDADQPPNVDGAFAAPGELWCVGKGGQRIRLLNDRHVEIFTPRAGNMVVTVGRPTEGDQPPEGYVIETVGDCIDIQTGSIRLRTQDGRRLYIMSDIWVYGSMLLTGTVLTSVGLPPPPGRPDDPDGNPEP